MLTSPGFAFPECPLEQVIELLPPLRMNTVASLLPFDELRFGHGLLDSFAVARIDEIVHIAGNNQHLQRAPLDRTKPMKLNRTFGIFLAIAASRSGLT